VSGEPVKWRAHFNQLIARPIPEEEFPKLARKMLDDGLIAILSSEGIQWYAGRYLVAKKVVRDMWTLSESQLKRFERWVYMNDPFITILSEAETMLDCAGCGLIIDEEETKWIDGEPHCGDCYLYEKYEVTG